MHQDITKVAEDTINWSHFAKWEFSSLAGLGMNAQQGNSDDQHLGFSRQEQPHHRANAEITDA